MSEPEAGPARSSLAEKVDLLFRTVRPPKGEFSYQDVATALQEGGGPTISATYVWQLRRGIRDNPTKKHLEALARFFGVAPSYFFDEDSARRIERELELLTAMRDPSVRALAVRAAALSPDGVAALTAMADQVERLGGGGSPPGRRTSGPGRRSTGAPAGGSGRG